MDFKCIVCSNPFKRKPCEVKKGDCKFCTKACYFSWQKGRKKIVRNSYSKFGANNPNWKGGIDPPNKRFRQSNEYKQWRESIFERDNWTCQDCGNRSAKNNYIRIEAHHIKPFASFPALRLCLDNGLTLCKPCHDKKPKGKEIWKVK